MPPDSLPLDSWIPVLDKLSSPETGADQNLDWLDGEHTSRADPSSNTEEATKTWEVSQTLTELAAITGLLNDGTAVYAVEARCLGTSWCQLFVAERGAKTVHVRIPVDNTRGEVSLCPGVLTLKDCELATGGLHPIHQFDDKATLPVAAGHWLILGQAIPIQASDKESMLTFEVDKDLPKDHMRIEPRARDDDTRFVVKVTQDVMTNRLDSDLVLQWGCGLAVLAMLPYIDAYKIEDNDSNITVPSSRIGQDLANQLQSHGIPLWDQEDEWDPARAMTFLLPLPDLPNTQE